MRSKHLLTTTALAAICLTHYSQLGAQDQNRPYRLPSVDLKQQVIWGAECRLPEGSGLAFGGQDQDSQDGRPHTRVLVDGEWVDIHKELAEANPLQDIHDEMWGLRCDTKDLLAHVRRIYFKGLVDAEEKKLLAEQTASREDILERAGTLKSDLARDWKEEYAGGQSRVALALLDSAVGLVPSFDDGIAPATIHSLHQAQVALERAAEALDAEPSARAMNCDGKNGSTLVYDTKSRLYVLFGGDHLDYLTNDTWVFDPEKRRWFQRHPKGGSPSPRANHQLEAKGDGKLRLTGGYTYSSNTDYCGGQYLDLGDGPWTYDIAENVWNGGDLTGPSRTYREGPFHPDYYLEGPEPDAGEFSKWLDEIPANRWVPTDPPKLPRLNRDWGVARIDPDHDLMLRWSGGHSAHGGSDVPHYHFSTNRWELSAPVEFPLGQLYSNTSYPNGYNFNLRPWITGHTYQNYAYDPPSKLMVKAGRPRHFYVYDPTVADWVGRGEKPDGMKYNSCFYTLTLTATPAGIICWGKNGLVHRYDHTSGGWVSLKLEGEKLPGANVDNSSIVYDSRRDRVLMINTQGYQKPFEGEVWSLELKTSTVKKLIPDGIDLSAKISNVDKSCYDPVNDLMLLGAYLKDSGDHTPTPAYDCANNRWIRLDIGYETGERLNRVTREMPHNRSDGMMFDEKRKLIWGTNTNSQVWVLRLERE